MKYQRYIILTNRSRKLAFRFDCFDNDLKVTDDFGVLHICAIFSIF